MKATVLVPTDINEITLGSYQKFINTSNKSNDNEFLAQKMVEIFCGIRLRDVLEISLSDVNSITAHLTEVFSNKPKFQNRFTIETPNKKIEFGFIPSLEDLSFGEYIDLESNLKDIKDFNKAMAVLYRPIVETQGERYSIEKYEGTANYAEVMKSAPLGVALSAKVFFYNLTNDLLNSSLIYLKQMKSKTTKEQTSRREDSSISNGDSIIQYTQLLKETLDDLKKLQSCPYSSALRGLPLKNKKQK